MSAAQRRSRRLGPVLDAVMCVGAAEVLPALRLCSLPPHSLALDDARALLQAAERERVDVLVARGLRKLGVDERLLDVAARERSALAMSVAMQDARARLTRALDACGVRHVVLKGALSDALFWGGRGVRGVSDIDLLVRREDEALVDEALTELGLRRPTRVGAVTDRVNPERLYVGDLRGRPLNVDLHVAVCRDPPYRDPGPDIVARRVVHETPLGSIPSPTPEDALLHATLNLATAKFYSGRTKLLLDAACYLSCLDVDLDAFAARARAAGASWAAWALLSLVRQHFVVDVPDEVMLALEPTPSRAVIAKRLAGIDCVPRVPGSRALRVLVEWPLVERPLWPAEILLRWASWRVGDARHRR